MRTTQSEKRNKRKEESEIETRERGTEKDRE